MNLYCEFVNTLRFADSIFYYPGNIYPILKSNRKKNSPTFTTFTGFTGFTGASSSKRIRAGMRSRGGKRVRARMRFGGGKRVSAGMRYGGGEGATATCKGEIYITICR